MVSLATARKVGVVTKATVVSTCAALMNVVLRMVEVDVRREDAIVPMDMVERDAKIVCV